MIYGIRHIGIVVREIEDSIGFYRQYFGFEVKKDIEEKGQFVEKILSVDGAHLRTVKMLSPSSEVMIELIHYIKGPVIDRPHGINHLGPTHFAVTVPCVDYLYDVMIENGVRLLSEPYVSPDNYAKVAFCMAPEGTYVEMVELLS